MWRIAPWVVLSGCVADAVVVDAGFDSSCLRPPRMQHQQMSHLAGGEDLVIEATATDADGVLLVEARYRRQGDATWSVRQGQLVDVDLYEVVIEADELDVEYLDYFVRGTDHCDVSACVPVACADDPIRLEIAG